jgi:anti-sigma factor RsiW
MECHRARELIQERLEGGLEAGPQRELGEHLAGCTGCRAFGKGVEALDTALKRQPLEDAPEGFAARVAAAASRDRMKVLTYERRNLRIAAACIAAAMVIAAFLPFFVALPDAAAITETLAVAPPSIPDKDELSARVRDFAPRVPDSAPTLDDAVAGIRSSWEAVNTLEIPKPELAGSLMLVLAVLAAAGAAFEAFYLVRPFWRKR